MQDTASVTLDSLSFKVASYQKSDQAVFGSRFGSGSVDETDLTLLKTLTFEAIQDGSFANMQKSLNPYLISGRANYNNGTLLAPIKITGTTQNTPIAITLGSQSFVHYLSAWTIWQDQVILAYRVYNKNYLYRYQPSNKIIYRITLPATLENSTQAITSFAPYLSVLMMVSPISSGMWYLNTACDTVTLVVAGGDWAFKQAFILNNKMYLLGGFNEIMEFTGTLTTVAYTLIAPTTQDSAVDYTFRSIDILNGRAYIAFGKYGLWCFDGVRAYTVLSPQGGYQNYINYLVACSGYIYFVRKNILFRFNGSSIEKLYVFPSDTVFQGLCSVDDLVYIQTLASDTDEISIKLKKDPDPTYASSRVYSFDGVNLYLSFIQPYYQAYYSKWVDIKTVPSIGGVLGVGVVAAGASVESANIINEFLVDKTAATPLLVVFNKEEMRLPNINKLIQSVRLSFLDTLNLTGTSGYIKLYYRLNEVSDWVLCKTFTTNLSEYSGALDVAIPTSKRFYFKLDVVGTNIQFESLSLSYILQPPLKHQWNMLLNPATNTLENPSAYDNTFAAKITALRTSSAPFTFVDLNGVSYSAIVDSFVQKIDPAYAGTSNNFESQFSVVLREV